MGQKTVRFSDLSGEIITQDDAVARIVIHEHPELGDSPVEIEVLPADPLSAGLVQITVLIKRFAQLPAQLAAGERTALEGGPDRPGRPAERPSGTAGQPLRHLPPEAGSFGLCQNFTSMTHCRERSLALL